MAQVDVCWPNQCCSYKCFPLSFPLFLGPLDLWSVSAFRNKSQKVPLPLFFKKIFSIRNCRIHYIYLLTLFKSLAEKLKVLHLQLCYVNEKTALKWIKSKQKIE